MRLAILIFLLPIFCFVSCGDDMDSTPVTPIDPMPSMDMAEVDTWISTITSQVDDSYQIDLDIDDEFNYLIATEKGIGRFEINGAEASYDANVLRDDDDRLERTFVYKNQIYRFYSYRINRGDDNPRIFLEVIDQEGQILETSELPKNNFVQDVHFYSDREMAILTFNPSRRGVDLIRYSIDEGLLAEVELSRNQSDAPSRLYVSPSGKLYPYWPGVFDDFDNFFRVNADFELELSTQLPMAIYGLSAINDNELFAVATRQRGAEVSVIRLNNQGDVLSENSWLLDDQEFRPNSIVHTETLVFTQEWLVEQSAQLRIRSFDHNLVEKETTLVDGYIGYSSLVLNENGGVSFFHGSQASSDFFHPRVVKMGPDCLLPETVYDN